MDRLLKQIRDLEPKIKPFQLQARRCEKKEELEISKAKKAIGKGYMAGAWIYAENAISKRTQQTEYLQYAAQLDANVSRLDMQAKMISINNSMASIVESLESTLATVAGMSETMNQFGEVEAEFMVSSVAIERSRDLKCMSKSLHRRLRKCEKEEASEILQIQKAIEKGNMDGAWIYNENAIRKQTEQLYYSRLISLLDDVLVPVDILDEMGNINNSMSSIVEFLNSTLATVAGTFQKMSETMDKFEKQILIMEMSMAGYTSKSQEQMVISLMQALMG